MNPIGIKPCTGLVGKCKMPRTPHEHIDLVKIGHGVMFIGSKGIIIADFKNRMIIPLGVKNDMTQYRRRSSEELLPPVGNFQNQWINACKNGRPSETACNFEYSSYMIETMCLGLASFRAGDTISYNGSTGQISNNSEANRFLSKSYRHGWTING